ncbi:MAG: hypothetical protein HY812_20515 [Planctomycetes bacterium]|nr:hypothetical protein [Planctomycetota bacterium]
MKTLACCAAAMGLLTAAAAAQDVLYATQSFSNVNLLTANPLTGSVSASVPVTNEEALFGGLACDLNGDLYSIDGYNDVNSDRTFRIDLATGAGTVVGNTGYNWNFRCVDVHPPTGVLCAAHDSELFILDKTTGAATLIAPITGATLDQVTSIAIDSQGNAYVTDSGGVGLFQLNLATGAATHLGDLNLTYFFQDLAFDTSDGLWGVDAVGGMYRINLVQATATFQYSTPAWRGIAFKRGAPCAGSISTHGSGCPGSGGFVPVLAASGCPVGGQTVTVDITQALGPCTGFLFFGLGQGALSMGGGCTLNVVPLLPLVLAFPIGGSGPGAGSVTFGGTMPASVSGVVITLQAFTDDSGGPMHFANSNGVQLTIP